MHSTVLLCTIFPWSHTPAPALRGRMDNLCHVKINVDVEYPNKTQKKVLNANNIILKKRSKSTSTLTPTTTQTNRTQRLKLLCHSQNQNYGKTVELYDGLYQLEMLFLCMVNWHLLQEILLKRNVFVIILVKLVLVKLLWTAVLWLFPSNCRKTCQQIKAWNDHFVLWKVLRATHAKLAFSTSLANYNLGFDWLNYEWGKNKN